eukprot:5350404-Karenia_brevis.AAC.1
MLLGVDRWVGAALVQLVGIGSCCTSAALGFLVSGILRAAYPLQSVVLLARDEKFVMLAQL